MNPQEYTERYRDFQQFPFTSVFVLFSFFVWLFFFASYFLFSDKSNCWNLAIFTLPSLTFLPLEMFSYVFYFSQASFSNCQFICILLLFRQSSPPPDLTYWVPWTIDSEFSQKCSWYKKAASVRHNINEKLKECEELKVTYKLKWILKLRV